ncbi:MAG: histidinol-phosphatase HisJ family protein [Chloroflexi bacterium]|nr:histidinol-phosphatase HisJ family protein [Chloroflexota bacterium]
MPIPWMISLHGGHSGDYCLHGADTLREMLDAAVTAGFTTFGVTTHAPRSDAKFLYSEEIDAGHGPDDVARNFRDYAVACAGFIDEYRGRLEVLCGAEIEVVPESSFADEAAALRGRHGLDYLVGSVHWVDEMPIDTSRQDFERAVAGRGGLEPFVLRYYELAGEMVERVSPEVIGHLDLPRLYAEGAPELESGTVRNAVGSVLERALAAGSILDVNVRAEDKGLATPYPAPWIVRLASEIGVPLYSTSPMMVFVPAWPLNVKDPFVPMLP